MKIIEPSTPYGYSIFCDDIRTETNGKLLFVGVYFGEMLVNEFPAILPNFSIAITYAEKPQESDGDVIFRIFVPGKDMHVHEITLERSDFSSVPIPSNPNPSDTQFVNVRLLAQFRNFIISEPGSIKVRAYRKEEEIRLGALGVQKMPTPISD